MPLIPQSDRPTASEIANMVLSGFWGCALVVAALVVLPLGCVGFAFARKLVEPVGDYWLSAFWGLKAPILFFCALSGAAVARSPWGERRPLSGLISGLVFGAIVSACLLNVLAAANILFDRGPARAVVTPILGREMEQDRNRTILTLTVAGEPLGAPEPMTLTGANLLIWGAVPGRWPAEGEPLAAARVRLRPGWLGLPWVEGFEPPE
ncbi:MAG TPA: hypothetical protein VGE07_10940 [Herpetosiphonaceae bacterium]